MIDFYNLTYEQVVEYVKSTCPPDTPPEKMAPMLEAIKIIMSGGDADSVQVKAWVFSVASVLSTWANIVLSAKEKQIRELTTENEKLVAGSENFVALRDQMAKLTTDFETLTEINRQLTDTNRQLTANNKAISDKNTRLVNSMNVSITSMQAAIKS